jgi:hypothetical protein
MLILLVGAWVACATPSPCVTIPPGPDDLADLFIGVDYLRAHPQSALCLRPRTHAHLLELFDKPLGVVLAHGAQVQFCARCTSLHPERDWPVPFESLAEIAREMYMSTGTHALPPPQFLRPIQNQKQEHATLVVHWTMDPHWSMNDFRVTPTWSELEHAANHIRDQREYTNVIIYAYDGARDQAKLHRWTLQALPSHIRLQVIVGSDTSTHSEEVFRAMIHTDGLVVMGPDPVSWWAAALTNGYVWYVGTDELSMKHPTYFHMEGGEEDVEDDDVADPVKDDVWNRHKGEGSVAQDETPIAIM